MRLAARTRAAASSRLRGRRRQQQQQQRAWEQQQEQEQEQEQESLLMDRHGYVPPGARARLVREPQRSWLPSRQSSTRMAARASLGEVEPCQGARNTHNGRIYVYIYVYVYGDEGCGRRAMDGRNGQASGEVVQRRRVTTSSGAAWGGGCQLSMIIICYELATLPFPSLPSLPSLPPQPGIGPRAHAARHRRTHYSSVRTYYVRTYST